jgi:hypothetical protein
VRKGRPRSQQSRKPWGDNVDYAYRHDPQVPFRPVLVIALRRFPL